MSDEQEPLESSADDSEPAPDSAPPEASKDLPLPMVVIGIAIAVLVFGYLGWQRYQALNEEAFRELNAGMKKAFEEGTAEAHRLAAEKAAAEAAETTERAEQDPGAPLAPAPTASATQTKPSGP